MENLTTVAVSKGIKANLLKEAVASLPAGEYTVDAMVHVLGTIKKGEDYNQVIHQSADPWGLLAMALSKLNGVTVEALIKEAMNPANVDTITKVKEQAKDAIETAKVEKGIKTCQGKVTTKVNVRQITV
jgi:hypothetical protein